MYKLFFIARNNMKKQKGDMITFFILTLFAAFLIFDAASAILGVGNVLQDRYAETNSPDVILITDGSGEELECARQAIAGNPRVKDFEATPVLRSVFRYRNAKDADWEEYDFLIESADVEKRMMVHDPENTALAGFEISVPLYLQGKFAVGDTLQLGAGDDVYDFRVAGYMEDPYFCSSMNITVYYVYMGREAYDTILAEHPEIRDRECMFCKGIMIRMKFYYSHII